MTDLGPNGARIKASPLRRARWRRCVRSLQASADEQAVLATKTGHAACSCRTRAQALSRLCQSPDLSRLHGAVSERRVPRSQCSGIYLWPLGHADGQGAGRGARGARGRSRRPAYALGSFGHCGHSARARLGRRSCARHRQRISPNAPLLRPCTEAARGRDHLLRPSNRRGHQRPRQRQYQSRLHRVRRAPRPSRCRTFRRLQRRPTLLAPCW